MSKEFKGWLCLNLRYEQLYKSKVLLFYISGEMYIKKILFDILLKRKGYFSLFTQKIVYYLFFGDPFN